MTFWAWEQPVKGSSKLVLLAMANCHNEDTDQCYPSISYIVNRTGLNERTVIKSIRSLTEGGYIDAKKSHGAVNRYTIKPDRTTPKTTCKNTGTCKSAVPVKVQAQPPVKVQYESKRESKKKQTPSKDYAFSGETIKLSLSDYQKFVTQYPQLDLTSELEQLDLELRGKKSWFMTLNAKLNYRNGKAANGKNKSDRRANYAEAIAGAGAIDF